MDGEAAGEMEARVKPICANCQVSFYKEKMGVVVVETFGSGPMPYKIWMADLWECPGCHARIVSGFGNNPICEHRQEDFKRQYADLVEKNPGYVFYWNERVRVA
mgnify:CR=1 FL=1